jgi:pyruvate kinase
VPPGEVTTASQTEIEPAQLDAVIAELLDLRTSMLVAETAAAVRLADVHPDQLPSARNLVHYMALRARDIRPLQQQLAVFGLSSLGRSESHVLATVDAVLGVLCRLAGRLAQAPPSQEAPSAIQDGRAVLDAHSATVLGAAGDARSVLIMVTMPSEAASDYGLVRDLLAAGMDIMRINCAHDGPEAWTRMVEHFHLAEHELDRTGRILMDLPGPKLRTGPIVPGPEVVKWRPVRDDLGRVCAPARVWLTAASRPRPAPSPADATLPVEAGWLARISPGDGILFRDARGARRQLQVVAAEPGGYWVEARQTAYVASGQLLLLRPSSGKPNATRRPSVLGTVGVLPARLQRLHLQCGDTLILTNTPQPGEDAVRDSGGTVVQPAHIGCTLPDVFHAVRPGDPVWLDDGKIGGIIRAASLEALTVEITQARPGGEKLGADKGINLPQSNLQVSALTGADVDFLPLIVQHADLVGYSFVHSPEDVIALQQRLAALGGGHLGIILKIETRAAFERLPSLLLAAMRNRASGVMIARGDLAVECGFERLAEVQEEILFISEAAHMPVIWATQVLEQLAQDGIPSRAEITDAAMGERAECVMLNKGPYILDAVRALDNILRRMQDHQSKKSAMLRQLSISQGFFSLA